MRRGGSRGPARVGSVNLRDVAAKAGVSPATASRVFGGSESVHAETRARVLAAAAELGYVMNGLARSMLGRGPRTIAFVVRQMIGPTFAALAAGVESLATENGYLLLICTTGADAEREREVITTLQEQRVFAVLLVGSSDSGATFETRMTQYARELATIDAPLIFCGRPPIEGHPEIVSVEYDQKAGIAASIDHLESLGHRDIVYVGQPRGRTTAELRMDGYIAAMASTGLAEPRIVESDNTEDDSARAVGELLDAGTAATALVCMTDNIAVGAYRALRARGMRIPGDMSVVGFDDVPIVADLTPGLTTVRPPFREVGVDAAEIALGLRPSANVLLAPQLIVRGSTAPPRDRPIASRRRES